MSPQSLVPRTDSWSPRVVDNILFSCHHVTDLSIRHRYQYSFVVARSTSLRGDSFCDTLVTEFWCCASYLSVRHKSFLSTTNSVLSSDTLHNHESRGHAHIIVTSPSFMTRIIPRPQTLIAAPPSKMGTPSNSLYFPWLTNPYISRLNRLSITLSCTRAAHASGTAHVGDRTEHAIPYTHNLQYFTISL